VKQGNRLSVMPVEEAVAKNFRYGWDGAEEYLRSNGNYFWYEQGLGWSFVD